MRSYRLPFSGLLLVVLSGLAPLSSAADGEGMRVRGRLTSYVDITVPETFTVSDADIQITSAGRFAGFFLLPDTSARPTVGALSLRRAPGKPVQLGESWTLYPGGYRLYLLSELPTEVFVPIEGFAARTYSPSRRADVRLHALDFVVGPSDAGAERRIRLPLRGRRTLLAAVDYATSTAVTGSDAVRACVVKASVACRRALVPTVRAPAAEARSSHAALQLSGTYDAVFALERAVGLHGETKVAATAITLDVS